MFTREQLTLFNTLHERSSSLGVPVYIVGGVLRDMFLGDNPAEKDVDFCVEGDALSFARACSAELGGEVREFSDFLTAKLQNPTRLGSIREVDFATARTEVYHKPGALPRVTPSDINKDLARRDFSVNALAISLANLLQWVNGGDGRINTLYREVLDPSEGKHDCEKRIVRVLYERSFIDDPTRIFRACRYAARMNGRLESKTEGYLRGALDAGALATISNDRKLTELKKIFAEIRPEKSLKLLARYGVFSDFGLFPSVQEDEVFLTLKKLSDLDAKRENDFTFELGLRVFGVFGEPTERQERFRELGFGKKQLRRIEKDIEDSQDVRSPYELSDEALVLSLLWDSNRNIFSDLASEGRRRGLIVCTNRRL